jgi:hypothetical protein
MNGEIMVQDDADLLAARLCINPAIPWPVEFWFGCYDADALAGFVKGVLQIPYRVC